jgi:hypothetical protein
MSANILLQLAVKIDQKLIGVGSLFNRRFFGRTFLIISFKCNPVYININCSDVTKNPWSVRMKASKLILIATMLMPVSANAGFNAFINGQKLHDKSTAYKSGDIDNAELYDAGAYVYYVMGVVDASMGSGLFCPQNITSDQAANIVSKYLDEHQELWSKSAESLVKDALMQEWPCPK